jgi:hypothetical protein
MLSKLRERNVLLGRVTGELVLSVVDETQLGLPDYLVRLDDFWKQFTTILYRDGLNNDKQVRVVVHSLHSLKDAERKDRMNE